jgi:hypothetical protein
MQYAWAAVFLLAGFMGFVQEYQAIQQGQALLPWGSRCRRDTSPRSFWFFASLGIFASAIAIVMGTLIAVA